MKVNISTSAATRFTKGQQVAFQNKRDEFWIGVVSTVKRDGTYVVTLNDGDVVAATDRKLIAVTRKGTKKPYTKEQVAAIAQQPVKTVKPSSATTVKPKAPGKVEVVHTNIDAKTAYALKEIRKTLTQIFPHYPKRVRDDKHSLEGYAMINNIDAASTDGVPPALSKLLAAVVNSWLRGGIWNLQKAEKVLLALGQAPQVASVKPNTVIETKPKRPVRVAGSNAQKAALTELRDVVTEIMPRYRPKDRRWLQSLLDGGLNSGELTDHLKEELNVLFKALDKNGKLLPSKIQEYKNALGITISLTQQNADINAVMRDVINAVKEKLSALQFRWSQESAYENISDYASGIQTLLPESVKFISMTARPFGFVCVYKTKKMQVSATTRGIYVRVLR